MTLRRPAADRTRRTLIAPPHSPEHDTMFEHHHAEYRIRQAHDRAEQARLARQAKHTNPQASRPAVRARHATARALTRLAERLVNNHG